MENIMELIEVCAALSSARHRAGLSQKAAALATNLTQSTISRYESGDLDAPVSSLLRLAHAYNCTLSELFTSTPELLRTPSELAEDQAPT